MGMEFVRAKDERGADARVVVGVPGGGVCWPEKAGREDKTAVEAWWAGRGAKPGVTHGTEWAFGGLKMPTLVVWADARGGSQAWFRAWAAAGRALAAQKSVKRAAVWGWPEEAGGERGRVPEALIFGAYSPKKGSGEERETTVAWTGAGWGAEKAAMEKSRVVGEALSEFRDLANTTAVDLSPKEFAKRMQALAKKVPGLSCKVWTDTDLRMVEKCGAIVGVAEGSWRDERLVRLSWEGKGKGKKKRPLALVGKGVTFDAGGICLKPAKGMEWMQYDKCGAVAVAAATVLAARLGTERPVTAWMALADNMPGGDALRPGDIVTARNGKTIQVVNTDAEGRLLLADALCMASEEKPAAIADAATLTGAVVIALGRDASAVLGDDLVADELEACGALAGERLWRLPIWPETEAALESPFADCKNMGDGTAGTIAAAAFLRKFVPEGIPWAHLDIAGTAWVEKASDWAAEGATLAAARLLYEWVGDSAL
ncbi:MAG: leucyl aminopeptidase family protein [Kiritimatiellae bacterium]|nr:leucyl aminopeptidase family protein [Kiritimatiellia bacterium]